MPESLATVNVWLPDWAAVNSGAHSVLDTVTASAALPAAAGMATIVRPAASAGTAMRTPATTHGRPPASRSQRLRPGALAAAADEEAAIAGTGVCCGVAALSGATPAASGRAVSGRGAGLTARPALMNAGMTTTR
jgi:hypothetical protein